MTICPGVNCKCMEIKMGMTCPQHGKLRPPLTAEQALSRMLESHPTAFCESQIPNPESQSPIRRVKCLIGFTSHGFRHVLGWGDTWESAMSMVK